MKLLAKTTCLGGGGGGGGGGGNWLICRWETILEGFIPKLPYS